MGLFGNYAGPGAAAASRILLPVPLAVAQHYRMAIGLGLSILVHLLVILIVRPMAVAYAPPKALQVEIRQVTPHPDALLGVQGEPGASDSIAPAPLAAPAGPAITEPPPANTAAEPVAGPELLITPDSYYAARELDVLAQPLNEVDLVYPQLAYQMRTRGKVTLRILINERGGIDRVSVLDSEPRGTFEEAALTAIWAVQFSPAKKNGRSVKSQKTIEVTFDPYERINTP